jgi:hypothetical protein
VPPTNPLSHPLSGRIVWATLLEGKVMAGAGVDHETGHVYIGAHTQSVLSCFSGSAIYIHALSDHIFGKIELSLFYA